MFLKVCDIRAPGAPGPVYEAYLDALRRCRNIILFIFLLLVVILSFGEVLTLSSANQTLATLVGGLVPIAVRMMRDHKSAANKPGGGVDLSTLSFRLKLDEVIANFRQSWPPACDFEFQLEPDVAPVLSNDDGASTSRTGGGGGVGETDDSKHRSSLKSTDEIMIISSSSANVCNQASESSLPAVRSEQIVDLVIEF